METIRRFFQVDRNEINYLSLIIESYDGMALVRTEDPYRAIIEVRISPGCEGIFSGLIESLCEHEGIKIIPEKS